ncbi:MAG: hypothetical protein F6J92_23225, partial [Symploca sp. SIO1A3]|nr:hypothetical protein [Symploca sp. SIO1A3]
MPHHADFVLDEGTIAFWVYVMQVPSVGETLGLVNKEEDAWETAIHFSVFVNDDGELI